MSRCADREAGDLGAHGCGLGAGQADVGANVPEELAAAPLESVVAEVGVTNVTEKLRSPGVGEDVEHAEELAVNAARRGDNRRHEGASVVDGHVALPILVNLLGRPQIQPTVWVLIPEGAVTRDVNGVSNKVVDDRNVHDEATSPWAT